MKVCPDCGTCFEDWESACVEAEHAPLKPGHPGSRVVAGKYRLERLLARGGSGVVFLARHTDLDRPVALKLLRSDLVVDPEARERFRREARAVARINHPAVAAVYDYGVLRDGTAYIVLELVEGETLRHALDRRGRLAVGEAARIGRRLAEGVTAAHAGGVLHRDLKPSNVVLLSTPEGNAPKIVDFSIAKVEGPGASGESLTGTGGFLGTPHYMSPEQCEGRPLDARSDVYALGVLLYEMLAGRPPLDAPTPAAIAVKQLQEQPAPLLRVRPEVPEELGWLVMQCLSKNPARRPESAAEVAERLRPFESGGEEPADSKIPDATPKRSPAAPSETRPRTAASPGLQIRERRGEEFEPPAARASDPVTAPVFPAAPPAAGESEPTGGSYWRSLDSRARGGRTAPPTPALVYGALLAGVALAVALGWLLVRTGPPRRTSPKESRPVAARAVVVPGVRATRATARPPARSRPATALPVAAAPPPSPAPTPAATPRPSPTAASPVTTAPAVKSADVPPPVRRGRVRKDDPRPALREALNGWIAATNARDVPDHMRFYMPRVRRFYLRRDVSRDFVLSVKRELFSGARSISVSAGEPRISTAADGKTATMRFRKSYVIGRPRGVRQGEVVQELVWVKTPEGWRIVGERDAKVLR